MTALDLFTDVVSVMLFVMCTSAIVLALVGIQSLPGPLARFWKWATAREGLGDPLWFVLAVFGGFAIFIVVGEAFDLTHVIQRGDVLSASAVATQFLAETAWTLYMVRLLLRHWRGWPRRS